LDLGCVGSDQLLQPSGPASPPKAGLRAPLFLRVLPGRSRHDKGVGPRGMLEAQGGRGDVNEVAGRRNQQRALPTTPRTSTGSKALASGGPGVGDPVDHPLPQVLPSKSNWIITVVRFFDSCEYFVHAI